MNIRLLALLMLLSTTLYGQANRSFHWYFGYEAGIDFSSGQPVADTSGKLISIEGSSSVSDQSGRLLFYSNGEAVWNRHHLITPNSSGLAGDQSSAQSSLIVPLPDDSTKYYLFTSIGYGAKNGLYYSIVDMNLDGGLGDINAAKNIQLYNSGTEELAGTMHCNAHDYWIVGRLHAADTLKFCAYLLNRNGLRAPVISTFPLGNPSWNKVGSLTFSQNGKTLCFSSFGTPICIFNFNRQTGQLVLQDTISRRANQLIYSTALSPNGQKLYVTSWASPGYCILAQFDLSAAIIGSTQITLDSVDFSRGSPNGYGFIGQVRLGPDQKIYVCRWNQDHPFQTNPNSYYSLDSLDVVHNPDNPGYACNFQRNFLYLNHKPTQIGLPTFISNFTSPTAPAITCSTEDVPDSTKWLDIQLYPNPFVTGTCLRSDLSLQGATLKIYNAAGQKVRQMEHINGRVITIPRGDLPSGLYYIYILQGDQFAIRKVSIGD